MSTLEIELNGLRGKGLCMKIDCENEEMVRGFRWYAQKEQNTHYVYTNIREGNVTRKLYLHRYIMGLKFEDGVMVDHVNGNALDNRKENLRLCTHTENMWNKSKVRDSKSKYKGVHKNANGYWVATIQGRDIGHFLDEVACAHKYDYEALIAYGEFAKLNFPNDIWDLQKINSYQFFYKNATKYVGVALDSTGKWVAYLTYNGERVRLGLFYTDYDGARYRDKYLIENNISELKLNFPNDQNTTMQLDIMPYTRKQSSVYIGVTYDDISGKWIAMVNGYGVFRYIGKFTLEELAARAHDVYAKFLQGNKAKLNFPDELDKSMAIVKYEPKRQTVSKYRGVTWNKSQQRWRSRITVNGTVIHIGYFDTEIDAAKAYNEMATKYLGEKAILNNITAA